MKIVLEDAKFFKSCVDAIVNLIDEGEFDVDEGGIGLRATDPSGIAMVEFKLPRSAFKEFSIESPLKLGVDFSELARITSRVRAKESVTITIDEGKTRIGLKFKEKTTRSFNIPLIDISSTELPSPKIDFSSSVKINAGAFKESLKDAALFSSHVLLNVEDSKFKISAKGSGGEVNIDSTTEDEAIFDIISTEQSKSTFPLDYLQDILKATDQSTAVNIELRSDAPVKVNYNINNDAVLTYYLAPRIEK